MAYGRRFGTFFIYSPRITALKSSSQAALRLQNSSLTAELFSIRQDNISWSLQLAEIDDSRQSLRDRKADQSFEVSTIHELQIQVKTQPLELNTDSINPNALSR